MIVQYLMIELFIAFGAGLISFLSPCVLPLIPGYISYISGSSLNKLIEKKNVNLIPIILFTVGFSIVFIVFGAASTFLGQVLLQNSYELRIAAGLVIVVLSLHIIGIINIKFLNFEKRIHTNKNTNFYSPIIIGMAFAFGWTPCIGPILGSILVLAATEENINKGILLLVSYSLGLALPFILSGFLIQRFLIFSKNFKKNINLVSKIGGIILLITGILILTNQLQALGYYLLNVLPFLQNFG
jgi:cytochrome c-type biogenesis protein